MAAVYGKKARDHRLSVSIRFTHRKEGIVAEVINSATVTPIEEKRFREKLEKIMAYEDLMQFYMDHADDSEGAGMGLALIVNLMKSMGINPELFRIFFQNDSTVARMEIPFSKKSIPARSAEIPFAEA
jgi:hypothetical protein